MNKKLEAIAKQASENLLALIKDGEPKILEAWNSCEEEAQLNEAKPKFKLGLSIVLDLDGDKMDTALSFGVKHTLSVSGEIPDPLQTKLPIGDDDTKMSVSVNGGKPVETTAKKFHDAAARFTMKAGV